MRKNMMNNCRSAMSRVPGVDRNTMKDVLTMTLRSSGSADATITESLLGECEATRSGFRTWMSSHI